MELYHGQQGKVNESLNLTVDFSELEEMARNGLLSLSVQLGIKALKIMLEDEVASYAGKKGRHDPSRTAYRHGYEKTSVVLGGQKIAVQKPRVRTKDGSTELPIETLIQFQKEDALNNAALQRILHGVSVRNYGYTLDEVPEEPLSISKSAISRRFIKETEKLMQEFMNRQIDDYYPILVGEKHNFLKLVRHIAGNLWNTIDEFIESLSVTKPPGPKRKRFNWKREYASLLALCLVSKQY